MKITELNYGEDEDGYPIFTLKVNGREAMMGQDSFNTINYGYISIDGVGLPETIIRLPGNVELEGQYTNDPVLLRISRQFLDDINSLAVPFETILGPRPIPRA